MQPAHGAGSCFTGDSALQATIDAVEDRYSVTALDDEALDKLWAAGDPYLLTRISQFTGISYGMVKV